MSVVLRANHKKFLKKSVEFGKLCDESAISQVANIISETEFHFHRSYLIHLLRHNSSFSLSFHFDSTTTTFRFENRILLIGSSKGKISADLFTANRLPVVFVPR